VRTKLFIQSSFFCILILATAGCDRQNNSVDTTLPTEDIPELSVISGSLSYPSDYIPNDMEVCAKNVETGKTHCDAEITVGNDTRRYALTVPPGSYHVYAKTSDKPGYNAYYSEAVVCGLKVDCLSSKPITVTLAGGAKRTDVDPHDWYADTKGATNDQPGKPGISPNNSWLVGTWADGGCEGDGGETYLADQGYGTWSEEGRWSLAGNRLTVIIDMTVRDTESGEPEPIDPPRRIVGTISDAESDSFMLTVNGEKQSRQRC